MLTVSLLLSKLIKCWRYLVLVPPVGVGFTVKLDSEDNATAFLSNSTTSYPELSIKSECSVVAIDGADVPESNIRTGGDTTRVPTCYDVKFSESMGFLSTKFLPPGFVPQSVAPPPGFRVDNSCHMDNK